MGKFEENWKEVFERAEISPPNSVWSNIDRELVIAEGESMKNRVVLYQRIAAASVLFALLIGLFGIYRLNDSSSQVAKSNILKNKLHSTDEAKSAKKNQQSIIPLTDNKDEFGTDAKKTESKNLAVSPTLKSGSFTNVEMKSSELNKSTIVNEDSESTSKLHNSIQSEEALATNKDRQYLDLNNFDDFMFLPIPEIQGEPVMVELARKLPAIPGAFLAHDEKKITHEQVWASVTAASGSYSPNVNSYSNNYTYAGSQSGSNAVVGTSYSFGMLAGVRVARRVVLQSGVQYMNQSINSTSIISAPVSLATVANSFTGASQNYSTSSPYSITSANEFVSVPVQAGYLFIDKKVGLQVNSGVSTDFFVRNTLSDPSGQRQSYSQSAGQDSPYRSVNFAGLLSSEVSYKMGSRYRVSLVPGLHYSLNPILKSAANSSGNPMVWDVGFRFRYIFR